MGKMEPIEKRASVGVGDATSPVLVEHIKGAWGIMHEFHKADT